MDATPSLRPKLLAIGVFAGAFFFRLFSFRFQNDAFHTITAGHQMTLGALPGRDFIEDGRILQVVSSYLLLELFGHGLLGELLLSCGALALAAALTCLMAARVSGSAAFGLAAAGVSVIAVPTLYSYPKVLLPLLGVYAAWCYARRPSPRRVVAAGALAGLAFLFRLDLVAYVAPAGSVIAALRPRPLARLALYAAAAAIVVAPFLAYLALTYSVPAYFRDAFEVGSRQADGALKNLTRLPPFRLRVDPSAPLLEERWVQGASNTSSAPVVVNVRWALAADPPTRAEREQRYGLREGTQVDGPTWRYVLGDASLANLTALLEDRLVEDTNGIDRSAASLSDPSLRRRILTWVTSWRRFTVLPGYLTGETAGTWLLWLVRALPIATAILLLLRLPRLAREPRHRVAALCLASLTLAALVAGPLLMRDHADRAADVAPLVAALAAWPIALLWGVPGAWLGPVSQRLLPLRRALVLLIAVLTVSATAQVNSLWEHVERLDLEAVGRAGPSRVDGEFRMPRVEPSRAEGYDALVLYLNECTRPDDYLLLGWFSPETYFIVQRRFAGLIPTFSHEVFLSPETQARATELIARQAPPIVVYDMENPTRGSTGARDTSSDPRVEPTWPSTWYPIVHRFIVERYALSAVSRFDGTGRTYAIWADRARTPTRAWGRWALPCFA